MKSVHLIKTSKFMKTEISCEIFLKFYAEILGYTIYNILGDKIITTVTS